MNISEDHKEAVLEAFREQYRQLQQESSLPPPHSFFVSSKLGQAIAKFLGSRRTASVIVGAGFGFNYEFFYNLIKGAWSRFDDWVDGQSVDIQETKKYADMVSRHANVVMKAMIHDMALAIQDKNWIKVAKIQRAIESYGDRAGYEYETRHQKIAEDGGAAGLGGGAPTNNVGGGHIAGAAGDPPGPRTYLRKRMMIRRKKPLGESLKHGTYSLVGYSFNPRPVRHYAAVNKRGKYLHTTSEKVAMRHAHSGGLHEGLKKDVLFRLTHIYHEGEQIGQIRSISDVHYEWKHTGGSNARGVAHTFEDAKKSLVRTHRKHKGLAEGRKQYVVRMG